MLAGQATRSGFVAPELNSRPHTKRTGRVEFVELPLVQICSARSASSAAPTTPVSCPAAMMVDVKASGLELYALQTPACASLARAQPVPRDVKRRSKRCTSEFPVHCQSTQSGPPYGKQLRVEEKDGREKPTCKPETLDPDVFIDLLEGP